MTVCCVQVDPLGPLANLKKLLFSTDNAIVRWMSIYWFIPAVCVACLLTVIAVSLLSSGHRQTRFLLVASQGLGQVRPEPQRGLGKHACGNSLGRKFLNFSFKMANSGVILYFWASAGLPNRRRERGNLPPYSTSLSTGLGWGFEPICLRIKK